jgi:3-phenylpropionate/cinnamic acid dioxygenase small subunit
MTDLGQFTAPAVSVQLYCSVQLFYARQMQLLDDGNVEAWVDTFAEDAPFYSSSRADPVVGRPDMIRVMGAVRDGRVAAGIVRRHWIGMLDLWPQPDGTVHTRAYAIVFATRQGEGPAVQLCTVCRDVLAPQEDTWCVRERRVTHDGAG